MTGHATGISSPARDQGAAQAADSPARPGLEIILASLDDDRAADTVTINLSGKTHIADHMVVASGRSRRHVGAMAENLARRLKTVGAGRVHIEGMPHCDWVVMDAGDVIVHLFRPEVRGFYNLEKLWSAAAPPEGPPEGV